MTTPHQWIQHTFFVALLLGAALITFFIFKPFLAPLVLAGSLAVLFSPLYRRLKRFLPDTLAAIFTVILVIIIVLIPFILIGQLIFNEAQGLYQQISNQGSVESLSTAARSLEQYIHRVAPNVSINAEQYVQTALSWILNNLNGFFSGFLRIILALIIMSIALFYILRDGYRLKNTYIALSPLSDDDDEGILKKISTAVHSIITGSLILALIQGTIATVGLIIFGMPNPLILGVAATLSSFVPGVGTALILFPSALFLVFTGHVPQAIGLFIWSTILVGTVDNFISPYLFRRGTNIHPFFILIAVLGGIALFGPIGFILGPVVVAFLYSLLDIYPKIVGRR